jgi:hypothetical protein
VTDTTKLTEVRHGLLALHKTLLETERLWYEREHGRVESGNQLLQLLVNDPAFAWLRVLSTLIVTIDEQLEDKNDPISAMGVDKLLAEVRSVVAGSEGGAEFQEKFNRALQDRPDVVIAQSRVMSSLMR